MAFPLKEQGGKLTPEQKKVIRQVLAVGRNKYHAKPKELIEALVTGAQESGFKNLPIGAETSGGWRQERDIYYPDPTNVKHSATRFFKELRERSDLSDPVGVAAQAAQRSAYPGAYQPHVQEARTILKRFNKALRAAQTGVGSTGGTPFKPQQQRGREAAPEAPQAPVDVKGTQAYKQAALAFIQSDKSAASISSFLQSKSAIKAALTPTKPTATEKLHATPEGTQLVKGHVPEKPIPRVKGKGGQQLVRWAEAVEGTNEGTPRQSKWAAAAGISPSTAWCSAFVAYGLRKQGYTMPANPAYSGAWLSWSQGKKINYKNARPGDLLIFDWGDGGITDHVGIYKGHGQYIGGNNSNNSVGTSSVPTGNIVGVVRPVKKR